MKKIINQLKVVMVQMNVICNDPRANADYMIGQIHAAIKHQADIIIFPEACISGYALSDAFENMALAKDIEYHNERVMKATHGSDIVVIFGSFEYQVNIFGEDGRPCMYNMALVAQHGKWQGKHAKFLHPNYGLFDDSRHWRSGQKIWQLKDTPQADPTPTLQPVKVTTRHGDISLGVMVCEDMWHETYPFNPGKMLVEQGAEVLINISASPWGWHKNQQRHAVIKRLIADCKVPFFYVNNTGMQNNGKDIIVFDGSSTAYNAEGNPVFRIKPYVALARSVVLEHCHPINVKEESDAEQMYQALICGIREFWKTLPENARKLHIGLSGGIDSAVVAALFVKAIGRENVFAYNMPTKHNGEESKDIARQTAANLEIPYRVIPIQPMVDVDGANLDCKPGTLAYQNMQARIRLQVLATISQSLGGVFTCNGNKVEMAFGYATLYGDMGGCLAPIGDLDKEEVYQLGMYLNRRKFGRMVIPQACFDITPSAELETNQADPFDYGNLKRRGYHDQLVRAFVLFRLDPEWVLEQYMNGTLEEVMKLEAGRLKKLFPTDAAFVADLERCARLFVQAVFKRVQSAPILRVSTRCFGYDLRESMLKLYFTSRYGVMKETLLADTEGA